MPTIPTGNGCTGFIDGTWRQCCDWHDWAYGVGLPKGFADLVLGQCVAATGHPVIGFLMFVGVTLFGGVFYLAARLRSKR